MNPKTLPVTCPHCHVRAEAERDAVGQAVPCPSCGLQFVARAGAAPVAQPLVVSLDAPFGAVFNFACKLALALTIIGVAVGLCVFFGLTFAARY
jgi:hypothetical protein